MREKGVRSCGPPCRLPGGALEQPVELQLVLRPNEDRVGESAEQAVIGIGHLAVHMAAEAHALRGNCGVGQRRGAFRNPACKLDVGLKAGGVEAGIEVAILDRPPAFQEVPVIEPKPMARSDAAREFVHALRLLQLAGSPPSAPALPITPPPPPPSPPPRG